MAAVPVQMDVEEEEKGAQKSEIDELKKKIKDLEAKAEEKEKAYNDAAEKWETDIDNVALTDKKKRLEKQYNDIQRSLKSAEELLNLLIQQGLATNQQGKQEAALAPACRCRC